MLKTIPPTTNCGCGYFKTKCAEIHYQTTEFSILCIFCGMKAFNYQDFIEHFRKLHFDDFLKIMHSTAEPIVTSYFGNRKAYHDPLEFGDREVAANPDAVLKKLKEEGLESPAVKVECSEKEPINIFQHTVASDDDANCISRESDEHEESDNEYIICEVKVEQSDLDVLKPSKARKLKQQMTKSTQEVQCLSKDFENEEDENCVYTTLTNEGLAADMEHEHTREGYDNNDIDVTKHDTGHEDIDWSKPFEPNLLKNHEKRPYKPRNKPNVCTYCGRTFKRRYQLETHLNVHTGEKPHQCEICGRLFRAITTLTRHLNTHEQRQMFYCKFCKKTFTHKVALLSHELRHTQERKVPCDECEKWFYTANQMDTHKRKVHNKSDQDDLPFNCDICSKRYRSGSMLSTHKFKKHYKTAKFSCEQCGKKFVNEHQLRSHAQIHVNKE